MPRHTSTPELRLLQFKRAVEERQKATAERQRLRTLYRLPELQVLMRKHGVKTVITQPGPVRGAPNHYNGYLLRYTDAPYLEFYDVDQVTLEAIFHEIRQVVELEPLRPADKGGNRSGVILLKTITK